MKFGVWHHPSGPTSASPYRVCDEKGGEVAWANAFLDAQKLRQLSLRSLRVYAYDLLHLARWFKSTRHSLARLNQSLLLDYVRYQLEQQPLPTAQTINHRLCVARCLYRFHYGQEIPGAPHFQRRYTTRSPLGYGRRQPKITTHLRLRQPRRVIVPLSADQVAGFWKGFRTFRDLAIVALMLLDGLRSCEVLQLQLQDLAFSETRLHVFGKGGKERFVSPTGERAVGTDSLALLLTGRSFGCVRWGQVGTKTLPQTGCGSQNREVAGYNHSEVLNSPAPSTDGTDRADRTPTSAKPNVQIQIAMMTSSHVPRTIPSL